MIPIKFEPLDTWCFGDGTPFAGGSATQDSWGGLFPPYPTTVVGALRVALARANGWDGYGRWGADIAGVLGDGPSDLGLLSIRGPFVVRDDAPLFPMPHHVLGAVSDGGEWEPVGLAMPGSVAITDIGTRRLPALPDSEHYLRPADGAWVTLEGLRQILGGELPNRSELEHESRLWQVEERIGIARDVETRTAQEGALFGVDHVRPADGVGIGLTFNGLPEPDWTVPDDVLVPFGGEGRLARIGKMEFDLPRDFSEPISGNLVAVLLTPSRIGRSVLLGEVPLPGLPDAKVVSAVIDGTTRIGGWDSGAKRPLPLRSYVPAGSVLFLEMSMQTGRATIPDRLQMLGGQAESSFGFGWAALGEWRDDFKVQETE